MHLCPNCMYSDSNLWPNEYSMEIIPVSFSGPIYSLNLMLGISYLLESYWNSVFDITGGFS